MAIWLCWEILFDFIHICGRRAGCQPFENIERKFEKWTDRRSCRGSLTWMGNGLLCGFAIGSSSSGWNFLYKNEEKKIREKKQQKIKSWIFERNSWNYNKHTQSVENVKNNTRKLCAKIKQNLDNCKWKWKYCGKTKVYICEKSTNCYFYHCKTLESGQTSFSELAT